MWQCSEMPHLPSMVTIKYHLQNKLSLHFGEGDVAYRNALPANSICSTHTTSFKQMLRKKTASLAKLTLNAPHEWLFEQSFLEA